MLDSRKADYGHGSSYRIKCQTPGPSDLLTPEDLIAIGLLLESYGLRKLPSKAAMRMRRHREKHGNLRDQRTKAAQGTHTHAQWLSRIDVNEWRCWYCKNRLTPKTVQKEHRIPLARGGTNWPANLVPACRPCNSSKGTQTPMEYFRNMG